jgi:serpin B
MMHRTGDLAFTRLADAQVVQIPYGNGAWVMTLALPAAGTTPLAWLAQLDAAQLATGLAALRTTEVDLAMPRFRLAPEFQLRDALTALGMGRAFMDGVADFSGIANAELFITHVKQDVFIDVNEEGTEAAAVTQVGIGVTSAPQREVVRLDRPFVFFIRERLSGTILFAGLIEQPGA